LTPFNEREGEKISSKVENGYDRPQSDPFASLTRLRAIERGPNNLPTQPTPLIGREDELKAATQLLLRDDVRIVTFTGSGGSGKTRLSIETARGLVERFRGGVFFVSLAMLTDPNLVASEIVGTLGVEEKKEMPLIESLKDYLRDKRILLVLDNFEQVISAAPIVAELLSNCPTLKLLITSRSPLRVRGEHEFPVLPLPIPNLKNLPTFEALLDYAAVALFVQRAQNVRLGFSPTSQNARTIVEICARLDGLPLALELAAARIRILSPNEMLRLLEKEKGHELLTSGARDLPARQRTVHDTIAWSYELLDVDEKKLFRRLSVFVGGFSLEAAEAICNGPHDLQGEAFDGLSRLAEKSLLRREEVEGESQYIMLETIREFALELLRASGELQRLMESDTKYFLSLAERRNRS
jgi:predicted ATPase